MTRTSLLLVIAAALAGLLIWSDWGPVEAPETAALTPSSPAIAGSAPAAPVALAGWADHPLFPLAPAARRPTAAPPSPAAPDPSSGLGDAQIAAPSDPAPIEPVLQGLILTPQPGAAYLGEGPGGASHFLRPGEEALGLVLLDVAPGVAHFRGRSGDVTLSLTPPPAVGDSAVAPASEPSTASVPAVLPQDAFAPVQNVP